MWYVTLLFKIILLKDFTIVSIYKTDVLFAKGNYRLPRLARDGYGDFSIQLQFPVRLSRAIKKIDTFSITVHPHNLVGQGIVVRGFPQRSSSINDCVNSRIAHCCVKK